MRLWRTVLMVLMLLLLSTGASAQTPDAAVAAPTVVPTAGDASLPTALPTAQPLSADSADSSVVTGEQYQVRLRDLEQRINELKEEIFRSKARLSLLAESILQNVVGGSRAQIMHQNEMGSTYRLVNAVYSLDGAPILTRNDDNGQLAERSSFQVYNGQVGSGDHNLGVQLEYLGAGLPYMKGYRFRVRSSQSFSVAEGKAIQIRVVAYEKGGPLEAPENRPAIRYVQRLISLREAADTPAGENSDSTQAADAGPTP